MKILTIADLHGKSIWKQLVAENEADKIVFLGDYVDAFGLSDEDIYSNLVEVIAFANENPDKVVLLLGNHDIQYIYGEQFRCSGYRRSMEFSLHRLFEENKHLFQIAFQQGSHLWTHAGISKRWFDLYYSEIRAKVGAFSQNFAYILNEAVNSSLLREMLFACGKASGGFDITSGPLWVRPDSVNGNAPFNHSIHQIVGHTQMRAITSINKFRDTYYPDASITYIDAYNKNISPYLIEI